MQNNETTAMRIYSHFAVVLLFYRAIARGQIGYANLTARLYFGKFHQRVYFFCISFLQHTLAENRKLEIFLLTEERDFLTWPLLL